MKAICVYDDHIMPDVFIANIVGEKTFGDIILKRVSVRERFESFYCSFGSREELFIFDHGWNYENLKKSLKRAGQGRPVIHIFSSMIVRSKCTEHAQILFQKAGFSAGNYIIKDPEGALIGFIMSNAGDYIDFLDETRDALKNAETYRHFGFEFSDIECPAFYDLSVYSNFRNFITGGFDTRFFNSVSGDGYVVKKTSKDKEKIKKEYDFYHLLPDDMKPWFVMPYDYTETRDGASYSMKRYHMADLALRFVHGAIDIREFDKLMEIIFYFLSHRAKKEISKEEYRQTADGLYLTKVIDRIALLKKHKDYEKLNLISKTDEGEYIDVLLKRYEKLYADLMNSTGFEPVSVIGHGDLCFSNMLFEKNAELLMLIDPKGASREEDMWTDPYYDLAKLSHSVCGLYDLFNYGLYRFDINEDLTSGLEIDFDGSGYEKHFAAALQKNGYDLKTVRIFEVSLFLSMLPLHMDYPKKVFAFMKNAERIMDEIEGGRA
ncbi:MAG: hypothetical protein IK139_09205 [Lachnospiraceae bacterium]|nr:hypothetical protein [Lachnospiraceae bacterium]